MSLTRVPAQPVTVGGQGVVSWVGRSSIEVQATVVCDGAPALTATFVMVAKDSGTGKTVEINRLELVTPEDEQR